MNPDILGLAQLINNLRVKLALAGFDGKTLHDQIEQALEELAKLRNELRSLGAKS
jgi:hypothetical protein